MAKGESGGQKRKAKQGGGGEDAAPADAGQVTKKGQEVKEDVDELLAEIDEVLEENAEEFVRSYVQKGGQ